MTQLTRRGALAGAGGLALVPWMPARAQALPIRIGVLSDQSGTFRNWSGETSAVCTRQAVAEMQNRGLTVEVISGDHQNKPDVALGLAREWIDQRGVDVIVDVNNSAIALGIANLCRDKNKVFLGAGPANSALTGEFCTPNMVHWTYDTWMLAKSTGGATVRAGGDTWFFVTADFAFGHSMERDTTKLVEGAGGKVLGSARFPFPGTSDFASYLLRAQASGAKVIGLATAGNDTVNCIKQAQEFGLPQRGIKLAGMIVFITDVHAAGLATAQGLLMTEPFYWDLNDRTRAFLARVRPQTPNNYPNCEHAGCYAATLHYLKAAMDLGQARAKASGLDVVNRMKAMPTDDDCFGAGRIRADGRKIHPTYLWEVKKPEASKGPWDYMQLLETTAIDQAFRPEAEGGCALVK